MVYILIAAGVFVLDMFFKERIEERFEEKEERLVFADRIKLRRLHNYGAALHILDKKPQRVRQISGLITIGTGVCFVAMLFQRGHYLLKAGLALLTGGALSNLYDRFKRGYVVDYFSFQTKYRRFRRIVFNLADLCIFAGVFMIAVWEFFCKE